MTEKEKMLAGEYYDPGDEEIMSEQSCWQNKLWYFNSLRPEQYEEMQAYMHEVFADRRKQLHTAAVPCQLGRASCSFRFKHLRKFKPYVCR